MSVVEQVVKASNRYVVSFFYDGQKEIGVNITLPDCGNTPVKSTTSLSSLLHIIHSGQIAELTSQCLLKLARDNPDKADIYLGALHAWGNLAANEQEEIQVRMSAPIVAPHMALNMRNSEIPNEIN